MFRTKKKKAESNGAAARKRRDVRHEDDVEPAETAVGKAVDGESAPLSASTAEEDVVMAEEGGGGDAPGAMHDDDDDDDAMMERIRRRAQRTTKSKASAVSFGSNARKAAAKRLMDDDVLPTTSVAGGALSFAEQELSAERPKRKMKIRPNLSVSQTAMADDDDDERSGSQYSADMLAALMREQNVRMRAHVPVSDAQTSKEGESANGADDQNRETTASVPSLEEDKEAEEEEAFIPLDAKYMQARRNKRRVTFGVPVEPSQPPRTMKVEEPGDDDRAGDGQDDGDDPEDDQHKRWEEELMRRGGHHVRDEQRPQYRADGAKISYPTRKKIPHASLFEVLHSLQRRVDHGMEECERVSREDARLEAEASLLETKLAQQREELTVSSEKFEYFQEVEDFVKSLSYCLRAKLPAIQQKEQEIAELYQASATRLLDQREQDIADEVKLCLAGGTIAEHSFLGLQPESLEPSASDVEAEKANQVARFARFLRASYYAEKKEQADGLMQENLFDDAVEDVSSLVHVYGRFQEWRAKFPEVYETTYCDLALVKLYAPFVRHELLAWDPLSIALHTATSESPHVVLSKMNWFNTLRRHRVGQADALDEPEASLVRDIVMDRLASAVSRRFNPRSSVHTNSVILLMEDLRQCHATKHVDHALESVVLEILSKLTAAAKQQPLVALSHADAKLERAVTFGRFLVSEFNALVENAAALFVALPHGSWHARGFNCVMQVLHHLLAYLKHCEQLGHTALVPHATQTVQQLSSSSFMQSVLAGSAVEQAQFKSLLGHFAPYLR
ncbi:hypothetical protein ATCC90586_008925 [Pythium insidiosum]|nr:hypothetical protein ATCC90586_008925 [Pythium insidiosum]